MQTLSSNIAGYIYLLNLIIIIELIISLKSPLEEKQTDKLVSLIIAEFFHVLND